MSVPLCVRLAKLKPEFPGLDKLAAPIVYLMGCRTFNQFCCTIRAIDNPSRYCPFCDTELRRRGRTALDETDNWLLLENEFPHMSTAHMLLVVPKLHTTRFTDLADGDWPEIAQLLNMATGLVGDGGIMWRFGDPKYHMGTVEHLHINVIRPTPGQEYRPPFAKSVTEHAEDYARLVKFCVTLFGRGGTEFLYSKAGIEETQPSVS